MSARSPSIETILMEAVEIASAADRQAFVEKACAGDAALRQQVEQLIANHFQAGSFLEQPAAPIDATGDYTPTAEHAPREPMIAEAPGTVIGPYKLLEQIGEGGMGLVFVAEQQHPVKRRVALKIIKPGMDSRQVIARFEAERQALALMEHPNIAKVLDGGAIGEPGALAPGLDGSNPGANAPGSPGRPYFVMELVKGTPITDYCDQHQLTTRQRLALFLDVCHAVQHAHQKGIIHRDIKPSNVLVSLHDTRPVVKVIDFGIAKATSGSLTDKTVYTAFAQMLGTPLYMSPEQAGLSDLDVDTRSDVYSLGVLLYELLTGTTPFDGETLKKVGYDEMRRIIREDEPPRPSARLSTMQRAHLSTIAAQRGSEPRRLSQHLRGELDWIVMRALEKDRDRRYESASAFAADVQRYLNDEPVLACPPSAAYRLRKFVRRHRTRLAVASVLSLMLLIVVGVGGGARLWWGQKRAAAESEARAALREADDLQQAERWPEALSAARRAEGVLAGVGADSELSRQVEDLIADLEMARRLQEARLSVSGSRSTGYDWETGDAACASAFLEYGLDVDELSPEAAAERIQARSIRRQLVAALDYWAIIQWVRDVPGWRHRLAVARAADPDPWRNRIRECLERTDRAGLEQLLSAPLAADAPVENLVLLGQSAVKMPWAERAAILLKEAQQRHPSDFWLNHTLGALFSRLGPRRREEAIRYHSIAVALRPQSAGAHNDLGAELREAGRPDEAIAEYREALQLDKHNPLILTNLGLALADKGQVDKAIAAYREAIRINEDYASAYVGLGLALGAKGQLDEAIAAHQKAIAHKPNYAPAYSNLSFALADKGKLDEAIAAGRKAIELQADFWPAYNNLSRALGRKGKFDEAAAASRKGIEIEPNNPDAYDNLGNALQRMGRLDEAIAAHRKAIKLSPRHFVAHYNLGRAFEGKGKTDEAIATYRKAIDLKPDFAEAHCNLGVLLRQLGRFGEALKELRRGHELGSKSGLPWPHPSAQWLKDCERLAELDRKLPAVLSGEQRPSDNRERVQLAFLCQQPYKQLYVAALKLYEEAFAAVPKLLGDQPSTPRYNAACAAALAGCGQGKDLANLDDQAKTRLRKQALDWLLADLNAWRGLLDKQPDKYRAVLARQMQLWLTDADFAGVRGAESLAKLPPAEQEAWRTFWTEVARLLERAKAER